MQKRLDENVVLEMVTANGSNLELSQRFNVSRSTCANIKQGVSWQKTTGAAPKKKEPPPVPPPQVKEIESAAAEIMPDFERQFLDFVGTCTAGGSLVMDCIILFTEKNSMEVEGIAPLIQKNLALKVKLEIEAQDLHHIKRTVRLPI